MGWMRVWMNCIKSGCNFSKMCDMLCYDRGSEQQQQSQQLIIPRVERWRGPWFSIFSSSLSSLYVQFITRLPRLQASSSSSPACAACVYPNLLINYLCFQGRHSEAGTLWLTEDSSRTDENKLILVASSQQHPIVLIDCRKQHHSDKGSIKCW